MLDNLREQANSQPFFEDEAQFQEAVQPPEPNKPLYNERLLGMTPVQRFIIAFMLMIATCALGSMCLLMTGKLGI